jgi:hypothetical protein
MTINLPLPKWLARKFARPRPGVASRAELKKRQVLPTLSISKLNNARFQDDDSPPGFKVRWHH